MAENFRNKQWFKKLSQEYKRELCEKFYIDEKILRKCGRETEDERLVIDILRIDHIDCTLPVWVDCANKLEGYVISDTDNQTIEFAEKLYSIFFPGSKFLKYKPSLHNDLVVEYATKYALSWLRKYVESDNTEDKQYYAYQTYSHVKCLLESDLQLVKKQNT